MTGGRDRWRRLLYCHTERDRMLHRGLIRSMWLPNIIRGSSVLCLTNGISKTRIRNRCVHTEIGRSVTRSWRLGRMEIKQLARQGKLMGVKKHSW